MGLPQTAPNYYKKLIIISIEYIMRQMFVKLSCYFKDDDELIEWINEQNLSYIFKDKNIRKEDIVSYNTQSKLSSFSDLDQIEEYIDRAVDLILKRNR